MLAIFVVVLARLFPCTSDQPVSAAKWGLAAAAGAAVDADVGMILLIPLRRLLPSVPLLLLPLQG